MAGVLNTLDAGSHRGPVRLRDPEAYQARTGEGDLHLRGRDLATNSSVDECDIRGAQVRSFSLVFFSLCSALIPTHALKGMRIISYT